MDKQLTLNELKAQILAKVDDPRVAHILNEQDGVLALACELAVSDSVKDRKKLELVVRAYAQTLGLVVGQQQHEARNPDQVLMAVGEVAAVIAAAALASVTLRKEATASSVANSAIEKAREGGAK